MNNNSEYSRRHNYDESKGPPFDETIQGKWPPAWIAWVCVIIFIGIVLELWRLSL